MLHEQAPENIEELNTRFDHAGATKHIPEQVHAQDMELLDTLKKHQKETKGQARRASWFGLGRPNAASDKLNRTAKS